MPGAQVPPSVAVVPSRQPSLLGSVGDACLGDGPVVADLLLDHVTLMRCVVRPESSS